MRNKRFLFPIKAAFLKKAPIAAFAFVISAVSAPAAAVTGSITDPGFQSEEEGRREARLFSGSLKTRLSRHIRRSAWENFFSSRHRDNFFDRLFIRSDFRLRYSLQKSFPSFKTHSLFFDLSFRRPLYETAEGLSQICFKAYFCFEEAKAGALSPLSGPFGSTGSRSLYLTIPLTSRRAMDQKKIAGLGASLEMSYPLIQGKGLKAKAISAHFAETAVYGSRYANEQGGASNSIASAFNQAGLSAAFSGLPLKPSAVAYISHIAWLDYRGDWFQRLALGVSSVWTLSYRARLVAGLRWGGAIFLYEGSAYAQEAEPFNPDETQASAGLIYSF